MELLASRLFLFAPAFLDLQAFPSRCTLELNPMQEPSSLSFADKFPRSRRQRRQHRLHLGNWQTKCQPQMLSLITDSHWKDDMHRMTDFLCGL